MKRAIVLLGAMVAMLSFFRAAHSTIWYVHPDSTLNSIQAVLDSCSTDDTVLVAAGTYYENLVWPDTQGIDLISESGPDRTVIDGGGTERVIEIGTVVDTTTTITGFTIQNGFRWGGAGIYCSYSSPTITGNTITGNIAYGLGGGGIHCWQSSPIITGNVITGNTAASGGIGGIGCGRSSPTIDSCTIFNNYGDGIYCSDSSNPVINHNNIIDNTGYGIQNVDSSVTVNAENNWWGDPGGPGGEGPASGDEVSKWVDYDPWLTEPSGVTEAESQVSPVQFILSQNYPNPFNPVTTIKYTLPRDCQVKLTIYNNLGQKVASLVDGKQKAGYKTARWDASSFSAGIYFYRLQAGDYLQTRKMILLK